MPSLTLRFFFSGSLPSGPHLASQLEFVSAGFWSSQSSGLFSGINEKFSAVYYVSSLDAKVDTCMTRSLHKARIHPTLIQRLSKLMVKENLDEQLMESLDYATISNALKTAGVSSWEPADRFSNASILASNRWNKLLFFFFLRFCRTWTKRYLITSQTRVKSVSRIHHRTILRSGGVAG